jgi:hypothetical protein
MNGRIFYLLFLVLCVFGNEKREALVDATLLEELLKLLLEVKVEGFELMETRQIQRKTRTSTKRQKKVGDAPEGR